MEEAIGITGACRVLGKNRSTLHRQRNPQPASEPAPREKQFRHPAELTAAEKEQVLAVLDSPRFADKAVAQAYTILLDEGVYLCSQATMHRLLRERGQSGERRAQAVHPARKKPELLATGPNRRMELGYNQAERPGPRDLVPAVCHPRHLFPQGHSLGDLADRDRHPGERIHRARHRRQRRYRAAGGARRPGHLDDL